MTDSRFNKGIEEIKTLSMTSAEKSALFERIMRESPAPVKSPWTLYSFNSWIMSHRTASVSFVAIIALILAGGGVASASVKALPGDALYGIKVHVVEPVRVALASTPAAKAQVEADLANTRLEEAQSLAAQGKLNDAAEHEISVRLAAHTEAFTRDVDEVGQKSPEEADSIRHGFEVSTMARIHSFHNYIIASSTVSTSTVQIHSEEHGKSRSQDKLRFPNIDNVRGSFVATTSNMVATSSLHIQINNGNSSHASVHIDEQVNTASVYSAVLQTQSTSTGTTVEIRGINIGNSHGKGRWSDK